MIIDGKAIAQDILHRLAERVAILPMVPKLTVLTCAPNFETEKFLDLKKARCEEVGIAINVIELPDIATTEDALQALQRATVETNGVLVQLPFPAHIDTAKLLAAIPAQLDVDATQFDGSDTEVLNPVVGAIAAIADRHQISFHNKQVVVLGHGRLVGQPAVLWAKQQGGRVVVVTETTEDAAACIVAADIIILGVGQPGLLTPAMIREGVAIFDAGTTEDKGVLAGDAVPACAEKASFFTPVPGGIGPITIAILLQNLVVLATRTEQKYAIVPPIL